MGNVQLGFNIQRNKDQIDVNGNIVRPFSKEILQKKEEEVIVKPPDQPERTEIKTSPPPSEEKKSNLLADVIKKQVQEQVQKTLAEIDIAKMVKDSIEEAFK